MKKFFQFCKECVAELKKVTWPTRNEVLSSVKVVFFSTLVVAVILGLLDWLFTQGLRLVFQSQGRFMSKGWYILQTFTGYEQKVERTLHQLLEEGKIDSSVLTNVRIPTEEVVEIRNNKKHSHTNKLYPGYVMLEMDLPELGWKTTCTPIRRIQGVNGFVGCLSPMDRPRPITDDEARRMLNGGEDDKGEKVVRIKQNFEVGETVKITEGPFATFSGAIEEVNAERNKLRVNVQIFGRATPVEVDVLQVEKI